MCEEAKSPAEQLAGITLKRLVEAGLVADRRLDSIKSKLLSGDAREQDWRIWILGSRAETEDQNED
ncbi:MAG: hypothetical protein IPM50_00195 [Acidobacteriota bacterium]|nr:MAG: hypothetical protein IPM50_00195 [Acidobacteriota bacterium]